jgi:hypothetical protein
LYPINAAAERERFVSEKLKRTRTATDFIHVLKHFTTMRKFLNTPKWATLATAAILMCGLIHVQIANGQCPTASQPLGDACDGTNWGGPNTGPTTTLVGTSCEVTFTYCIRDCICQDVTPCKECIIESVTPVPGSPCSGMTPDELINLLIETINTTGIGGTDWFAPPLCSLGKYQEVNYLIPDCWKETVDGLGNPTYSVCDYSAYCTFTTTYCNTLAAKLNWETAKGSFGTPTCGGIPTPDIWVIGTCYNITPCDSH